MQNTTNRLQYLDLFRGIAAFIVVLFHFSIPLQLDNKFSFGFLTVDLFFVLSGIVLGVKYSHKITNGMDFIDFSWIRLRRLYPMVIISIAFMAILQITGIPSGKYLEASNTGYVNALFLIPCFHNCNGPSAFSANGPLWSLCAELASNIIWYFALRINRKTPHFITIAASIGFVFFAINHQSWDIGWRGGLTILR